MKARAVLNARGQDEFHPQYDAMIEEGIERLKVE
jgi:hypothetical protein